MFLNTVKTLYIFFLMIEKSGSSVIGLGTKPIFKKIFQKLYCMQLNMVDFGQSA